MHRLVLALVLSIMSSGCLSPVIKSDAIDFGGVIEDTTNRLLVTNLLRARDKAPLHFADIPQLRESVEQTFALTWLNLIGTARAPWNVRDSVTLGTGFRRTPSFDLNHLH